LPVHIPDILSTEQHQKSKTPKVKWFLYLGLTNANHTQHTQPQRAVTQNSDDMSILSRRTATTRYQVPEGCQKQTAPRCC